MQWSGRIPSAGDAVFESRPTGWAPRLLPAALCCLILNAGGASGRPSAGAHREPAPRPKPVGVPRASSAQSRTVLACMRRSHLQHVTTSGIGFLWLGTVTKLGGFLYVQYYSTSRVATREAEFLRDEESGVAKRLVISQHVAPYYGSPVPQITRCLHGRMISKQPRKKPGHLHF